MSSRAGLLLASTHARRLGLGAKVTFVQADAQAIPLAANCVDRITCRCGIMFFSDTALVMSEVLRVLKPRDLKDERFPAGEAPAYLAGSLSSMCNP